MAHHKYCQVNLRHATDATDAADVQSHTCLCVCKVRSAVIASHVCLWWSTSCISCSATATSLLPQPDCARTSACTCASSSSENSPTDVCVCVFFPSLLYSVGFGHLRARAIRARVQRPQCSIYVGCKPIQGELH